MRKDETRAVAGFPPSHQNKIPGHFPDISGRFLKIPDSGSSVYNFSGRLHLPYTDPLPSPFDASISSFRHVQYLQRLYLTMWQFSLFSRCVYLSVTNPNH